MLMMSSTSACEIAQRFASPSIFLAVGKSWDSTERNLALALMATQIPPPVATSNSSTLSAV